AIGEDEVGPARVVRLEAEDDRPVVRGPGRIARHGRRVAAVVEMAVGVRDDLVVDRYDGAVDLVARVEAGPVASRVAEVAGPTKVGVLPGQGLADHDSVRGPVGYVGEGEPGVAVGDNRVPVEEPSQGARVRAIAVGRAGR